MDIDDAFDLLGNGDMPVRQQRRSLLRISFYSVLYISAVIALIVAYHNGRSWLRSWREYNYKKSVRRKYGIPDSSNEPFNVAYAKAQQRRKEMAQRMAQQHTSSQTPNRSAAEYISSGKQGTGPSIPRRRFVPATFDTGNVRQTEGGLNQSSRSFALPQNATSKAVHKDVHPQALSQARNAPKTRPDVVTHNYATAPSQRKRSLEKDDVDQASKKSRNDPSEQVDFTAHDSSMADDEFHNVAPPGPIRGAKRQAGSDEEIANVGSLGKKAGKRARRQSKKLQDAFNGVEHDELMDLDHVSRGKKRDRAEAGSSFGGDDDSPAGGRGRKNRRQKRKSNASTDMDAATQARGTKRSFDVESTLGSDDENGSVGHSKSSRKRGKRMSNDTHDIVDVSMEDSTPDTSGAGRKIGEVWLANGEKFTIGPDGRRLRQVLLKKRRSRFSMPEDSQHPDTQAHLEILIETWLNDDDFKAAEERGDVVILDKDSKVARELSSSPKAGKQLLWCTPQNGVISLKQAFKDSVVANDGVNGNPFERPSLGGYSKRVSIGLDSSLPSPTASPAIRQSKSYSKWEKQDLEAEAMAKLRKKLEEEKKAVTPISKNVSFQIPSTGTSNSAPPIASSSSAPATLPASSAPSKSGAPASTSTTNNIFVFPSSNGNATKNPPPSVSSTTTNETSQMKPPTITFTPPQPSNEPVSAPATKNAFGNIPFSTQSTATSSENRNPSMPGPKSNAQIAGPSAVMPNPFGQKSQDTFNAAASSQSTNAFAKPVAPSNVTNPVPNGTSGSAPGVSLGNPSGVQAEKVANVSTPFAFGNPSGSAFSSTSTSSPFGAPVNATAGAGGSNSFGRVNGSAAGGARLQAPAAALNGSGAAASPSPFSFGGPSNQASGPSTKPAEQPASGSGPAAPKFNFGFVSGSGSGSKPAAAPSLNQAPAPTSAPKATSSQSPFSFGSTPAAQNPSSTSATAAGAPAPAAGATAPASTFSFGTTTAPSSSMAAPVSASNAFGGNAGATTSAPAVNGFSFNFGAPKPATSSSAPSVFSNPSAGPSAKSSAPSFSSFGTAPSGFGSASNAASSSSSPFGAPAKPAGEVPKPLFGFGSNATTSKPPTADKQDSKPGFSFNFGSASATPTPAFGSAPAQNGASTANAFGNAAGSANPMFSFGMNPTGSAFGVPAGNANSSNPSSTNVFGSSSGTSAFGGQK